MSAREITEWMAFASIQPFGYRRTDWQFAALSAVMANCHRDPKKSNAFQAKDFLIFLDEEFDKDPETLTKKIQEAFGVPDN